MYNKSFNKGVVLLVSIEILSNNDLLNAYHLACDLKLSSSFIRQIEDELIERNLYIWI
ncbi:sporulation histidine kinase inhibitor Sda [Cytobacillus depressus]|uniref:Sporulation histidine kinase inhibitor Sda n=1 Tax=Cytobacillus depressus TaxID=1602942 RepID=A0A6L3VB40_9BACI|nr:sporulation histidine kinase inhibitor Sda [Cytobacillus depressus]